MALLRTLIATELQSYRASLSREFCRRDCGVTGLLDIGKHPRRGALQRRRRLGATMSAFAATLPRIAANTSGPCARCRGIRSSGSCRSAASIALGAMLMSAASRQRSSAIGPSGSSGYKVGMSCSRSGHSALCPATRGSEIRFPAGHGGLQFSSARRKAPGAVVSRRVGGSSVCSRPMDRKTLFLQTTAVAGEFVVPPGPAFGVVREVVMGRASANTAAPFVDRGASRRGRTGVTRRSRRRRPPRRHCADAAITRQSR